MTLKTDVLFLQKDRFEIYSSTFMRVFEFLFVPEIVQDFDIKNDELLNNLINVFIQSNKIPPSELIIVLSENVCFIKDFAQAQIALPTTVPGQDVSLSTPSEDLQKEIDPFIQHVPFDKVSYVTMPINNGVKVFATNEDLYKTIIKSFENFGFKVEYAIPVNAYGGNLSTRTALDKGMADFIIQNTNAVKINNFLNQKIQKIQFTDYIEKENEAPEDVEEKSNQKNNKRVFILIGVFVILLVVLVLVYLGSTH